MSDPAVPAQGAKASGAILENQGAILEHQTLGSRAPNQAPQPRAGFAGRDGRQPPPITQEAQRRIPAAAKVFAALVLVVSVAALPSSLGLWAGASLPLLFVLIVLARIPVRPLLRGILLAEPLVLGTALLLLLRPNGQALFLAVVVKATVCLTILQILIRTTRLQEIVNVLRQARFPGLILDALWLLHRYAPVLVDETMRMRRARAARTFGHGKRSSWQLLAGIVGILFVRSTLRAERLDAAMRSRGWS
jgi:cobalt/nickel transport system permease protein